MVKRYDCDVCYGVGMTAHESGDWVSYSDYAALLKERDALVAENAELKAFGGKLGDMHNDLNGEGTGIQGRAEVAIQQITLEEAMEAFDAIKTPATDAYLAEVRAQGVDLVCDYHKSRYEALHDVDRNGSQRHGAALCDAIDIAAQLRQGAAL